MDEENPDFLDCEVCGANLYTGDLIDGACIDCFEARDLEGNGDA
jgi:hypothetical protein